MLYQRYNAYTRDGKFLGDCFGYSDEGAIKIASVFYGHNEMEVGVVPQHLDKSDASVRLTLLQ
jgi:hypothetical protein